ncbi:fimbrial protein [Enterobacter pseudoroggenkampii]|uniref:fimbrial protein n=1 Tax=Enterobacter pseudoroggenkampii TaxID=2996112 RepID=UPI0038B380DA
MLKYLALTLLLFFVLTGESVATCSFVNGAQKATVSFSPTNRTRLPDATETASRSHVFSSSNLASAFGVSGWATRFVSCTAGETLIIGNSSYTANGNYLRTNVSGVYLNAQAQSSSYWKYPLNGGNYTLALPSSGYITPGHLTHGFNGANIINHDILMDKMSQGGVVDSGLLFNISTSDGLDILDVYMNSFTVTVPTCTVNNYDKAVDLGTVYTQQMNFPGSASSAKDFSINMTCASTSLTPTVTFVGEVDSNYPTVLVTNAGDATGVGVQLLYGGSPIVPGAAVSLGRVTTSTSSQDYNFQARAYQTSSSVTAGGLDFTATFTIDYE